MSRLTKRLFLMLSLTAVAVAVAGVGSASAAQVGSCVFTGLAGNLTPGVPAATNPAGPLATGTYSFSGDALNCALANSNGTVIANGGAHITSSGSYLNLLCGTGTATGTATVAFSNGQTFSNIGSTIAFVGGTGALAVTGGASGGGEVSIVPGDVPAPVGAGSGGNCVTTAVTQFKVYGNFTAVV